MDQSKQAPVEFSATKDDRLKIGKAADRALSLFPDADHQTFLMDLTAAHANGNPLDLDKLLGFDDFNFTHDICGINRHIDRATGKLMDRFSPRCSMPSKVA